MKHKTGIIFSLLLAVACAAAVYFYFPIYNTQRIFKQNLDEGMRAVQVGDLESGVSRILHAISIVGGVDKIPKGSLDEVMGELTRTAQMNPLRSEPVLRFQETLGIEPGCGMRLSMYDRVVKSTFAYIYKKKMFAEMGGYLYLAARWGGQCDIPDASLKKFQAVFDKYEENMGPDIVRAPWMTMAYNGAPVVAAPKKPAPPAPPAAPAAPATGGQPEKDTAENVAVPEPEAAANEPKVPAETAPAPSEAGGSFTVVDETKSEAPAPDSEKKPAPAPEKKPEPETDKKPVQVKKEPLLKEITIAKGTIITTLKVHDIDITRLMFRDDGVVIYVTFQTGYIGTAKLKDQVDAILDTIYSTVESTGVIPLQYISLTIDDSAGRAAAKLDVVYSDYKQYRDGQITWAEMRSRWEERIFE